MSAFTGTEPDKDEGRVGPSASNVSSLEHLEAAPLLAAIVESSEDAIISKDLQGTISSWNKGAERLFGYNAEEAIGKSITILIPDERLGEEPAILARIQSGERVDHFETVRRRKDGSFVDISLTISPVRNAAGTIVGASKIARDITERKRAAERQQLLLREMHHRVKNLFAVTGGLVTLAARSAESPAALASSLRARLAALAQAHELTLPNLRSSQDGLVGQSTTLFGLIQALVGAFQDEDRRVALSGDDIEVAVHHVTNVALLFHEFMTNSAKYGALSIPSGRLLIKSQRLGDLLQLRWVELGGPEVKPPDGREGFGSRLETLMKSSLQATILREWRSEGLVIDVSLPASAIQNQN